MAERSRPPAEKRRLKPKQPDAADEEPVRRLLWADQAIWPVDTPTEIFLGRAIGEYASTVYGTEWSPPDPKAQLLDLPAYHDRLRASPAQVARVDRLTRELRVETTRATKTFEQAEPKMPNRSSTVRPRSIEDSSTAIRVFRRQAWDAAKGKADAADISLVRQRREWYGLIDAFLERLIAGKLKAYTRPELGGALQIVATEVWNSERPRLLPRFETLRLDPISPFDESLGNRGDYLFVKRDEFDSWMASLLGSERKMSGSILPGATDMMEAMLEVWEHFNRRCDRFLAAEVAAKVREVFLEREFVRPSVITSTGEWSAPSRDLVDNVAWILRGFESKSGKTVRKGKHSRH